MVYLRTIISAKNELKYIKLQLRESEGYVDKIIVCEFNRTHTGESRELFFLDFINNGFFSDIEIDRLIYIPGLVGSIVHNNCKRSEEMHENEKLFRGYFVKHCDVKPNDIVICVDADEIVFRRKYEYLLKQYKRPWQNPVIRLKMYQFFYLPTYLWTDMVFTSAIICRAKSFLKNYPEQWRDTGNVSKEYVGCHFSWQLTLEEMVDKMSTYAHAADYSHLIDRDLLKQAIIDRVYPFEPNRPFHIQLVNYIDNSELYPDTYEKLEFDYLYEGLAIE